MLDDKEREEREGLHDEPSPEAAPEAEAAATHPVMELPEIPAPEVESSPAADMPLAESPVEPKRPHSGWKLFAAAVALVAVGAGIGSVTTWTLASQMQVGLPVGYEWAQQANSQLISGKPADGTVIPEIYRKLGPSVVKIDVQTQRGWSSGAGSGSGFVIDSRGYILTNHHVIKDANAVSVKFIDGTRMEGKVVGSDPHKDLAVVKVEPGNRSLIPAPLGDSDAVEIGELAIAIGAPLGHEFTITSGIVSALNRNITGENSPYSIPGGIQTDAAINPGNSGGPLINSRGEVIGINTAIDGPVRGNVGIGFAVPINAAKEVLPTLMAGERVRYAYLGVRMGDMTAALARELGVDVTEGAFISEVQPGTPAEKAGLRSAGFNRRGELVAADIVVEADGKPIRTSQDLVGYVASRQVGDSINLTVVRMNERITLTAVLADRDATPVSSDE